MLHNRKRIAYLQNFYRARACKPRAYLIVFESSTPVYRFNLETNTSCIRWPRPKAVFLQLQLATSLHQVAGLTAERRTTIAHPASPNVVSFPNVLSSANLKTKNTTCCQKIDLEIENMRRRTCRIHPNSQATSRTP
jgi:hypothetical protein